MTLAEIFSKQIVAFIETSCFFQQLRVLPCLACHIALHTQQFKALNLTQNGSPKMSFSSSRGKLILKLLIKKRLNELFEYEKGIFVIFCVAKQFSALVVTMFLTVK